MAKNIYICDDEINFLESFSGTPNKMETNPHKRWELLRKIDREFLGLVPTFPDPGRQWQHGQAPSGSWIEEEAPPICSTARSAALHTKIMWKPLETWKFLWKFIIGSPSLVTFRHLLGAVPWLAGKSMMCRLCRWFSQLKTSIYRGFPIAMFDYRRVMDLNWYFMDFISWFRTSSNLQNALSKFGLTFCSYAAHRAIWKHRTQYCPPPELHTS